jgi:hypothetical protein
MSKHLPRCVAVIRETNGLRAKEKRSNGKQKEHEHSFQNHTRARFLRRYLEE